MLLQLSKANKTELVKLFQFAHINSLDLKLIDEDATKIYLPGKPLTAKETKLYIEESRQSTLVSLTKAHKQIRKNLHED